MLGLKVAIHFIFIPLLSGIQSYFSLIWASNFLTLGTSAMGGANTRPNAHARLTCCNVFVTGVDSGAVQRGEKAAAR